MDPQKNVQLTHRDYVPRNQTFPICLVGPDIDVPMNVGSLFRIADALGVEKLYLTGSSPVPPDPKIRKTSRATENSVAYEYRASAPELIGELKTRGYTVVSLEITTRSLDIRHFDAKEFAKVALVVGAENTGVAQEILDISDYTIHIPMFGQNSSMNVATATAIAVFELTRRFMP